MCILLLSSFVSLIKSEDQETFFITIGRNKIDAGNSIQQTVDGGFITLGGTISGFKDHDIWLIKTDDSGNIQWDKIYGGEDIESGETVQQTLDDGFIIVGWTESYGNEGITDSIYLRRDVWLIKTDNFGNMEWNMTYGGNDEDYGISVHQTSDGGYIIGGETNSYGSGRKDIWVIKTDSSGKEEWNRTFGRKFTDFFGTIQITSDNGYIIVGSQGPDTNFDDFYNLWLIKIDSKGKEEWNRTFGENDAIGNFIQETSDGGFITCGLKNDIAWLIKTNNRGVMEWNKTYGENKDENAFSVRQTSDGGYIFISDKEFTVYSDSVESWVGNVKIWMVKTDNLGKEIWSSTFCEESKKYFGETIIETFDGGYIIVGTIENLHGTESDVLLIKTDSQGKYIIPDEEKKENLNSLGVVQFLIIMIIIIIIILVIWNYRKKKNSK